MTKKEKLLKEQIEELENIIALKDRRIRELERMLDPAPPASDTVYIPTVFGPVQECQHEYPLPWHGITPPPCKKCGKLAEVYTITCTNGEAKQGIV